MLFIPRGITHRSALCEESEEENVLVELKIAEDIAYVGDAKQGVGDAKQGVGDAKQGVGDAK